MLYIWQRNINYVLLWLYLPPIHYVYGMIIGHLWQMTKGSGFMNNTMRDKSKTLLQEIKVLITLSLLRAVCAAYSSCLLVRREGIKSDSSKCCSWVPSASTRTAVSDWVKAVSSQVDERKETSLPLPPLPLLPFIWFLPLVNRFDKMRDSVSHHRLLQPELTLNLSPTELV